MKLCEKATDIRDTGRANLAMRTDASYRLQLARKIERHMRRCGVCST